jgi:hypothetical protein
MKEFEIYIIYNKNLTMLLPTYNKILKIPFYRPRVPKKTKKKMK